MRMNCICDDSLTCGLSSSFMTAGEKIIKREIR